MGVVTWIVGVVCLDVGVVTRVVGVVTLEEIGVIAWVVRVVVVGVVSTCMMVVVLTVGVVFPDSAVGSDSVTDRLLAETCTTSSIVEEVVGELSVTV